MSRKERRGPRAERIRALLEAGDHRAARAEARAALAEQGTAEDERDEAARALASLAPERGAVVAGVLGVAAALAITALVVRS